MSGTDATDLQRALQNLKTCHEAQCPVCGQAFEAPDLESLLAQMDEHRTASQHAAEG